MSPQKHGDNRNCSLQQQLFTFYRKKGKKNDKYDDNCIKGEPTIEQKEAA